MEKEHTFISLVVYLHNQEKKIEEILKQSALFLQQHFEKHELIFVDDDSEDRTVEKLRQAAVYVDHSNMISLISMGHYQGLEQSMNAGRELSVGDFVIEMDKPSPEFFGEELLKAYEKCLEGNDIVCGLSGEKEGVGAKIFYRLYNLGSYSGIPLKPERFRIISRRAINRVRQMNASIPYRKAAYMGCGLKSALVESSSAIREPLTYSSEERSERFRLGMDVLILFTDTIERASMFLSSLFLLVTLGIAGYILWSIFWGERPVEGWLSMMGFMSFAFFGIFIFLTLVLRYLSVLIGLVFKNRQYTVENIEKITG